MQNFKWQRLWHSFLWKLQTKKSVIAFRDFKTRSLSKTKCTSTILFTFTVFIPFSKRSRLKPQTNSNVQFRKNMPNCNITHGSFRITNSTVRDHKNDTCYFGFLLTRHHISGRNWIPSAVPTRAFQIYVYIWRFSMLLPIHTYLCGRMFNLLSLDLWW